MLLKLNDGRIGEQLSFSSVAEGAFAIVKLPDCTLEEWNIKHCLVVEGRKISESCGTVANGEQQLKAEIAALLSRLPSFELGCGSWPVHFNHFIEELQQLSAI